MLPKKNLWPRAEETSEPDVCRALAAGEAWAAEAVYDRVADVVDGVLYRLLGHGDRDRDDLAQVAMERVISTIVSGRFSRECSLRTWATLVTQNLAIDSIRARSRERKVVDHHVDQGSFELSMDDGRELDRTIDARRRVRWLLSALGSIKPHRAEAVILHDILGYDLMEIASVTGITVSAAQSRLVRGRKEVLQILTAREGNS